MGLLDTMRLVEWKPMLEGRTPGLGITPRTTSDNLTRQETTNQETPDRGPDGADLSWRIFSVPPAPAVLDQHVVDIGDI